jgi:hypothetical protein
MAAAALFGLVLVLAAAFAAPAQPESPVPAEEEFITVEIFYEPGPATPTDQTTRAVPAATAAPSPGQAPGLAVQGAAATPDASEQIDAVAGDFAEPAPVASGSTSASPTPAGSSWSQPPVYLPPVPGPALGPNASWLANYAEETFGVRILRDGQDWGPDDDAQTKNIGAVISAMEMLPLAVSSSVALSPYGPLSFASNMQGMTAGGWQPYGNTPRNFYTNSDAGPGGVSGSHQVVLATGANRTTVAHEVLHAYQFRAVGPNDYVLALLGDEMKSFMAATGWRQLVSDDELRAAAQGAWGAIDAMFVYEGRPLVYNDQHGNTHTMLPPNPLEAFAMTGSFYYAPYEGMTVPGWPEHWGWFAANLGPNR